MASQIVRSSLTNTIVSSTFRSGVPYPLSTSCRAEPLFDLGHFLLHNCETYPEPFFRALADPSRRCSKAVEISNLAGQTRLGDR